LPLNLVGGCGVIVGGNYLYAGSVGRLLVDKENGARRAAGITRLATGVYRRGGTGGNGTGGKNDDGVGSAGRVDVSRVTAKTKTGIDGRKPGERGAWRHKVDVDGALARGLVKEAQRHLAGWRGVGLILEHRHLQACTDVAGEHGVLAARQKIAANRANLLLCASNIGGMKIRASGDGDVGTDRAEANVVENGRRTLGGAGVDVQRGRVGRYVDDANLRDRLDACYALATRQAGGKNRECGEPTDAFDGFGDGESHV